MAESTTEDQAAEPYYDKACDLGSDEACFRGAARALTKDPKRAQALQARGCRESNEFALKNCVATADRSYERGTLDDYKSASALYHRACLERHAPGCAGERRAKEKIKELTAPVEFEGTLIKKSGKSLSFRAKSTTGLSPLAQVEVQKYFESKPGDAGAAGILGGLLGGTVTGWMVVATAKVEKIEKDVVTLTIGEERSTVTINGKKTNHFIPGARMKLEVEAPTSR
jgi:hypothetical protein